MARSRAGTGRDHTDMPRSRQTGLTGAPGGCTHVRRVPRVGPVATIAVFPSVLGVRQGVLDARARLEGAGHEVRLVDLVGQVFDEYEPAMAAFEAPGFPARVAQAMEATAGLPAGAAILGWCAGAGLAQAVAMAPPEVTRAVLLAGAGDPAWFPYEWRPTLAAQLHGTVDDPWREQGALDRPAVGRRGARGAPGGRRPPRQGPPLRRPEQGRRVPAGGGPARLGPGARLPGGLTNQPGFPPGRSRLYGSPARPLSSVGRASPW